MVAQIETQAYVYCPHIIDSTKKPCGISESGKGKRTTIPLPFDRLGDDFVIECPACGNEILVQTKIVADDDDDEETA